MELFHSPHLYTHEIFHLEPENHPLEKETHLPNPHVTGFCVLGVGGVTGFWAHLEDQSLIFPEPLEMDTRNNT